MKALADNKTDVSKKLKDFFGTGRKHFGKRRKCWFPAFSPFPKMFSNAFFFFRIVLKSELCGRELTLSNPLAKICHFPPNFIICCSHFNLLNSKLFVFSVFIICRIPAHSFTRYTLAKNYQNLHSHQQKIYVSI